MMQDFVNVYDLNRKKVAVLQNAYNIKETQEINQIYTFSFNLPDTDPKLSYCQPFCYFRFGDENDLYRRVKRPKKTGDVGTETVTCEHVIATLCDNVMFGQHTYGGRGTHTREVIEYILSFQTEQNWILGDCDFDRQFEYNWEQENLLNALYSIPKVFTDEYMWTFDCSVYPWRLNLKVLSTTERPDFYIRAKRNLLSETSEEDYTNIVTRIYPLGYGEGINQLGIKEINNGKPYLDAPAAIMAKYGIKEKVLVDRRFQSAETLMAYAQSVLDELTTPAMSRKFNVIDLYPITSQDIDNAEVGKICKLTGDDTTAVITKTVRILDDPGNLTIDLSTKASDVASAIADLAERTRIEAVYAQGATQLYQHSKDANATSQKGMILSLYFPSEMKQINKVLLRLQLKRFRSYSATTEFSSVTVDSTEESARTYGSTASGSLIGNSSTSSVKISTDATTDTNWGNDYDHTMHFGGQTTDADGNGSHHHYWDAWPVIPKSAFEHTHRVKLDFGSHSHTFELPSHTHGFEVPAHKHAIKLPPHRHDIVPGIFESGSANRFDIYIENDKRASVYSTSYEDDITMWLVDPETGLVPRDQWIDMEIRPNDNAYIVASVFIQGFIQSRGGGNY